MAKFIQGKPLSFVFLFFFLTSFHVYPLARDGYPANLSHIFLVAGASAGVLLLISMLISSPKSGILIPIPQHPLYTATLAQYQGVAVPYHLDESSDWSTSVSSIETAIESAHRDGILLRALVIINPGNPTGALLDEQTQVRLVELCEKHSLVLLADEVYQNNPHKRTDHPFTSFKRVVADAQSPVPLVSFHSTSKGINGECGKRGGYFECYNISEDIIAVLYKMVSVQSASVSGMVAVDSMVRPPQPGDESYELYKKETEAIHEALVNRTGTIARRLNALPGVSCVDSPGAMYLYPKVKLPDGVVEAARKVGKEPDVFYASVLLDKTGICIVPGSGFGQKEGEWHFRLTCLYPGVEEYVDKLESFHREFVEKYGISVHEANGTHANGHEEWRGKVREISVGLRDSGRGIVGTLLAMLSKIKL